MIDEHDGEEKEADELQAKVQALKDRVSAAGSSKMPDAPEWNYTRPTTGPGSKPNDKDMANYRGLGLGITAAYLLVGFMIVGLGVGWAIDSMTKSSIFKGVFGMAGAVAGLGAIVYMTSRDNRRG